MLTPFFSKQSKFPFMRHSSLKVQTLSSCCNIFCFCFPPFVVNVEKRQNAVTARVNNCMSKIIHKWKQISLIEEEVMLPTGQAITHTTIHHPGAAVILPITTEGEIVLVHQFRPSLNKWLLELPAGVAHALAPDPQPGAPRARQHRAPVPLERPLQSPALPVPDPRPRKKAVRPKQQDIHL